MISNEASTETKSRTGWVSFVAVIAGLAMPAALVLAAEAPQLREVKTTTLPKREIPEPDAPGKTYPVPPTAWLQDDVLWGWTCELSDGSGLAFGGIHQRADDGNPHTMVLEKGEWKPIIDELRKKNRYQSAHEKTLKLRNQCKDTLARARHWYFEGLPAGDEQKRLTGDADLQVSRVSKDLAELVFQLERGIELAKESGGPPKSALPHLQTAAAGITPFGDEITPEKLAAMRAAQIELELAAECLGAEPPPRALSRIAYDRKTRMYVVFGGDHMDYATNDVWVFDPATRAWLQRHPESSPEPRGDHHFEALGDGQIAMWGGYSRVPKVKDGPRYSHIGPERWVYDIGADRWTAESEGAKTFPTNSRSSNYWPPAAPEKFMAGERPDAAAHQEKLKNLPINQWVRLETPIPLGGRDWGTWAFDEQRDMFYVFAGGHASYGGNDVARFHLATGRWEISDPVELPLGGLGTNEQYPSGFNFNLRPWARNHVWNSQAFDHSAGQLILVGATYPKVDPYCYRYDPDRADWIGRNRLAEGMGNGATSVQVRDTKHGLFAWQGTDAWLLDSKAMQWSKLPVQGKLPGTAVDSCGLVYDSRRDRVLFVTLGGYSKPFDGQITSLDLRTLEVAALDPQGMDDSKTWRMFLREVAYHPDADLFVWPQLLKRSGKVEKDQVLAYDAAKNRWVLIKTPGAVGQPFADDSVSMSIAYDAKRKIFWLGDAAWNGGVWAMRFDPTTATITPLVNAQ